MVSDDHWSVMTLHWSVAGQTAVTDHTLSQQVSAGEGLGMGS